MKSAEHLVRVTPEGPHVPKFSEMRAVQNARSQVERAIRIGRAERHLLETFEAPTFKKAMKDYTNFCAFLGMAGEGIEEIQALPSRRFAEMLQEAVTASPENAELFIESIYELACNIRDSKALKGAYLTALKTIQNRHPRPDAVLGKAVTQSVFHAQFFVASLNELIEIFPSMDILIALAARANRKILRSIPAKRRS